MPIENCRGKNKEEIIKNYNLVPITYVKLLRGQQKENCCGGYLKDKYYAFEYHHKINISDNGGFFVGYDCAEQLFNLLSIDKNDYPLFNPIKQLTAGTTGTGGTAGTTSKNKIHGLNKEVYNAINLMCMAWNTPPYGKILNTYNYVKNPLNKPTQSWAIKDINYIIGRYSTTLTDIVNNLRTLEPNLKIFEFPEMNQIIDDMITRGEITQNNI